MRAITLRFPRGGLPARTSQALAQPSAKMLRWGAAVADHAALRHAELVLAIHPEARLAKRRLRIPDRTMVSLSTSARPSPRPCLAAPAQASSANDNAAPPAAPAPRRSVKRDLFFLAMLAASLAGAYWQGRVQGDQKTVVVPGPPLPGARTT